MYVRYQFELVAWKRQKLKLGAIVFEIKEIGMAGITFIEEPEIRYIRQDTTFDDELKIENRLKALNWKWDFPHVGAFIIIASIVLLLIYAFLYTWYQNNLPTLAKRGDRYVKLINFTIHTFFIPTFGVSSQIFKALNDCFADMILEFTLYFDVLF